MTIGRSRLLLFALMLTACAEVSVRPGINQPYYDKPDPDAWAARFEVESREIYSQREEILARVGLVQGQRVADIGAGTGLFVPLFSRAVGELGSVTAVDIQQPFLDHIKNRAEQEGLRNVTVHLGAERSVNLPEHSIDVAFVCDTYHHFEYPMTSLESIHRALAPEGELIVIDFHRIPGKSREWILNHVRAGEEVFTEEILRSGFRFVNREDFLTENYFLRFRKRP
jgi:SAM-dependent methyltransferase